MQTTSLTDLVAAQLRAAHEASAGRSAVTVYGGREHDLRQTLIALTAGARLGEHQSPGEATLQVLEGQVTVHAGEESFDLSAGDHGVIPPQRNLHVARTDAAVLLTVATRA